MNRLSPWILELANVYEGSQNPAAALSRHAIPSPTHVGLCPRKRKSPYFNSNIPSRWRICPDRHCERYVVVTTSETGTVLMHMYLLVHPSTIATAQVNLSLMRASYSSDRVRRGHSSLDLRPASVFFHQANGVLLNTSNSSSPFRTTLHL